MADPKKLTKRQSLFLQRAVTVTQEQLELAAVLATQVFDLDGHDVEQDLIIRVAELIAANYHASLSDSNAPS